MILLGCCCFKHEDACAGVDECSAVLCDVWHTLQGAGCEVQVGMAWSPGSPFYVFLHVKASMCSSRNSLLGHGEYCCWAPTD